MELVSRAYRGQRLPQPCRGPGQEHADAVLALRRERSGEDLVRGVITAHGVDGDDRIGLVRAGPRGHAAEVAHPRAVAGIPGDPGPLSAPAAPWLPGTGSRAQRVTGACGRE